jgi:hypothetical protein
VNPALHAAPAWIRASGPRIFTGTSRDRVRYGCLLESWFEEAERFTRVGTDGVSRYRPGPGQP